MHTQETKDKISAKNTVHGDSRKKGTTKLYIIWENILKRCNNPNRHNYKYYGGKGIKSEWKNYEDFKKDMYESYIIHIRNYPNDTLIERIDSNKNYSKENCKWATRKENSRNKSNTRLISHNSKILSLAEWCEILKLDYAFIHLRLRRGWSFIEAISRPNPGRSRKNLRL